MNITYSKVGDYNLPDLTLKNPLPYSFSKYGLLRLNYLKQNNKSLYQQLLSKDELTNHLIQVDKTATTRVEIMVNSLTEKENVDEKLKAINQLKWVGLMNSFKNQAEEIIFNELIYN